MGKNYIIQKNVVHGGSQDTLTSFKYGWQTKISMKLE